MEAGLEEGTGLEEAVLVLVGGNWKGEKRVGGEKGWLGGSCSLPSYTILRTYVLLDDLLSGRGVGRGASGGGRNCVR